MCPPPVTAIPYIMKLLSQVVDFIYDVFSESLDDFCTHHSLDSPRRKCGVVKSGNLGDHKVI